MLPRNRASGGYNGGRYAFLHNRLSWISIRLSGCIAAVSRLPGSRMETGTEIRAALLS